MLLERQLQRLQVFAWLEAYSFSRRNVDFRARAGVPANTGLSRFDGEDAKAAQLDPIVGLEGIFHAIEDRIDCLFGFRLTHSRPLYDLIHEIEFDHLRLRIGPRGLKPTATVFCTLVYTRR